MMLEMSHISKVPSPPSLPIYPSPATRGAPAPLTCAFSGYRQVAKTKSGEGLAAASPRTSPSPMPRLQPVMSTERQRGWAMLQPRFGKPRLGSWSLGSCSPGSWSLGSARAAPVRAAPARFGSLPASLPEPTRFSTCAGQERPRARPRRGASPARLRGRDSGQGRGIGSQPVPLPAGTQTLLLIPWTLLYGSHRTDRSCSSQGWAQGEDSDPHRGVEAEGGGNPRF